MSAGARICHDDGARRTALRTTDLNGLDYLEVDEDDRHQLRVILISKLGPLAHRLAAANFVVCGGVRVRAIQVVHVKVCTPADSEADDCIELTVDHIGDFSTYTLRVVADEDARPTDRLHPDFDPVYACLDFSFQAGCPSPLDCHHDEACPVAPIVRPDIDYLGKDYASFRQVLLDRLRILIPGWNETHEPDLMVTLVELLAYEGDRLSYLQDAVATEAYLTTARRRISVRRHARLVDYHLHEGCNARAWVFVETSQDSPWLAYDDLYFITRYHGAPAAGTVLSAADLRKVPEDAYEVFEPIPEPPAPASRPATPRDPSVLCRRVLDGPDAAARYVRDLLDDDVVAALESWNREGEPSHELVDRLVDALDRLAHEQDLRSAKPFAEHARSPEARHMLSRPLTRHDMVPLNWILLRCAFQDELAPATGLRFRESHNRIVIHTWGERDCCLPRGTTTATLVDAGPQGSPQRSGRRAPGLQLTVGDWLLFEEVRDPRTGLAEDANPAHRHVVRLTRVTPTSDPVLEIPLIELQWAPEDALPFPLCLSSRAHAPECEWLDEVSVARGNLVLVDHGRRRLDELDAVEVDGIDEPCDDCRPEQELVPHCYGPVLGEPDLTFAQPLAPGAPAAGRLAQDPHAALPQVRLQQVPVAPPRLDLPDPLERYRNPVALTAIDPEDLVSPAALVERLQHASGPGAADALGTYLRALLDGPSREEVDAHVPGDEPSQALVDGLLRALNGALDDEDLDGGDRFPRAELDEPTQTLVDADSLPLDLRRLLRRWLLEQGVAEALAPTRRHLDDWEPRFDLLASTGDDRHFVVEMTDDRRATLRFGDDELGRRPEAATRFRARYRTGSGPAGNVGAEAIAFVTRRAGALEGLALTPRNPLAAAAGIAPESLDEARRRAPYSIRRDLVRAVIAGDYAALAARDFATQLQGAAAELAWTGSWYEADVMLDPRRREDAPPALLEAAQADLEHYRRMGHALRVACARYVPLAIVVAVCVKPSYDPAHVLAALADVFSSGSRADGEPGFFHPDNMRFRSHIDVSDIVALAQTVEGVLSCWVRRLERLGEGDAGELEAGTLPIGPTEIPRVDSRSGFPEFGSITFEMENGR